MYHPESDSLFLVMARGELVSLMESADGQLCNDVTESKKWQAEFIKRLRVQQV